MADNENQNLEESDEKVTKKASKHDSRGVADLEKVTDYVEEADIGASNIGDAMKLVNARQTQEASEKKQKEEKLSQVEIKKEDVEIIIKELELTKGEAERALKEHQGDLLHTLIALTD